MPWLFLNLQPAHHLFPGIHHSKLRKITPLIREHYPGLMDDKPVLPMIRGMYRILLNRACRQPCVRAQMHAQTRKRDRAAGRPGRGGGGVLSRLCCGPITFGAGLSTWRRSRRSA